MKELILLFLLAGIPVDDFIRPEKNTIEVDKFNQLTNRQKLTSEYITSWRVNEAGVVEVFFMNGSIGFYTKIAEGKCPGNALEEYYLTPPGFTALSYATENSTRCYIINDIPISTIQLRNDMHPEGSHTEERQK